MASLWLVGFVAYMLGNISFGLLIQRALRGPDLRASGSGNVGASNVWRLYGRSASLLTFFGDALKGACALWCALSLHPTSMAIYVAAFCVLLGHIYPLAQRLKGGKGVATFFGVMCAWAWPLSLGLGALWAGVFWKTRKASVASLIVALAAPLVVSFYLSPTEGYVTAMLGLLMIVAHKENIIRLWQGRENAFQSP